MASSPGSSASMPAGHSWASAALGGGRAESDDGGERLLGLLGLGEVVAVVRDGERVVQVGGEGACAFGEAPQLEQERVEAREIGLRPLARPRGRSASPARASSAST